VIGQPDHAGVVMTWHDTKAHEHFVYEPGNATFKPIHLTEAGRAAMKRDARSASAILKAYVFSSISLVKYP